MTDNPDNPPTNSAVTRTADGKFAPGSGGRPPGSRNKVAVQAISKIRELTDDAFSALADNIQKGDQRAVEFVLSRVIPNGRLVELEAANSGAVADALISGQISGAEAKEIATALSKLKEMEDMDALKERLVQIEQLLRG